jgi:uncharacterized Zn-finger protein
MAIKSTSSLTSNLKRDTDEAVCDGGAGALGHPRVYLPFGGKSEVSCYYCGKRFEKK